MHEAKRAINQISIRKRIRILKKGKNIPMRQCIDEVLKLITDLRITGAEISYTDSIVYILMSLPKEYELNRLNLF